MTFRTDEPISAIEYFLSVADVYSVNSSVWLVDWANKIATHCSDVTYINEDWTALYKPTHGQFIQFLNDENWQYLTQDHK